MQDWLASVVSLWEKRLNEAQEEKDRVFGKTADMLWKFLTRSYRDIYLTMDDPDQALVGLTNGEPFYKPRLNKCREFVALYLPFIAARVPTRAVSIQRPAIAEFEELFSSKAIANWRRREAAAKLLEWWLNYCAKETDHEYSLRAAVQEALVKGRGVLWTEVYQQDSRVLVGSSVDTVDNFLIDPSCRYLIDAGWVARRRIEPAFKAQERLGLDDETLRQLTDVRLRDELKNLELPADTVCYYEIYSRIGIGRTLDPDDKLQELSAALDALGPHVWLCIAPGFDYPLNLKRDAPIRTEADIQNALRWPIETFGDLVDPWPVTVLDFFPNVDNPWATSPLEPGLPLQVFIDHLYAYVMGRARLAARTIVVCSKEIHESVLSALLSGRDVEVVPVDADLMADFGKMAAPFALPDVREEIWRLFQLVERAFDRAVGLDALMYGAVQKPQARSALEIEVRTQFLQSRPSDFADSVEKWASRAAAKEAMATRLYVPADVVVPLWGEDDMSALSSPAYDLWRQEVATNDPFEAAQEYEYSVVAGSGRRKNKQLMATAVQSLMQMFGSVSLQRAMATGNPQAYNKLIGLLSEAMDFDLSEFMLGPGDFQAAQQQAPGAAAPQGEAQPV